MGTFGRIISWIAHKLVFALALAVIGLSGFSLWAYFRDQVDFDLSRLEIVRALTGETTKLKAALADVQGRMGTMRTEISAQQDRAAQAGRVARELETFSGGLNRLTGDGAQLKENDDRLARMRQMESDSLKRVAELQQA